ncbi:50S ribosomal protein L35 [bacterium]|nr:MAG: 50S ribosomal protein L35 [bacterium]
MPKMKTRKSAKKRFEVTKKGKVVGNHAGKIHFKRRKRANVRRKLKQKKVLSTTDAQKAKRMLPYKG